MSHRDLAAWTPPPDQPSLPVTPRLRLQVASGDGSVLQIDIRQRHSDETVGTITIEAIHARTHSAAISCWITPEQRRRGLATEALRSAVSALVTPQPGGGWGLRRLSATAAASDVAAVGLARSLGVRREQRRRQDRWDPRTGLGDTLGWAVLADEWDPATHRLRGADPPLDVGVGPHARPWPTGEHLDPDLLREGDRRNVADRYRYWSLAAIRDDLAARSHPFHVAVENWRHDMNIGTVVRNANAFGARGVHIVGRRQWNRRGAMVTDRYLTVDNHAGIAGFCDWATDAGLAIIGIDNLPGSTSIMSTPMPRRAVLLFGQEGPGLSDAARAAASVVLHIPQTGSTRSINAGVASGIAMAAWVQQHGGVSGTGQTSA